MEIKIEVPTGREIKDLTPISGRMEIISIKGTDNTPFEFIYREVISEIKRLGPRVPMVIGHLEFSFSEDVLLLDEIGGDEWSYDDGSFEGKLIECIKCVMRADNYG